jgi:hypothetical protein
MSGFIGRPLNMSYVDAAEAMEEIMQDERLGAGTVRLPNAGRVIKSFRLSKAFIELLGPYKGQFSLRVTGDDTVLLKKKARKA